MTFRGSLGIYSEDLLRTLEGKDYERTLPCTNPQASRYHGPVICSEPWICGKSRLCFAIFPFVFKRGPKANLQLSYVGSLLQSGMQLYGSMPPRIFFNARLFSVLLTLYGPRVASEAESATAVRTDGGSFTESWRERSASRSGKRSGGSSFSLSVSMAQNYQILRDSPR